MNFLNYFVGGPHKAQPSGRKAVTQTINDGGSEADMQIKSTNSQSLSQASCDG
jgi:hypothetical protein